MRSFLAAVAFAFALAPPAGGGVFVDRAARAFRSGAHVYVDPGARDQLSTKDQAFVTSHIARTGGPAFFAAVLPPFAAREVRGPLHLLADAIGRKLDCACTVAVVVGGRYAALSSALPHGRDRELLARALAKHRRDGIVSVLEDLDTRIAREIDQEQSGGSEGIAVGAVLTAIVVGSILFVVVRRRRWWRELARVRGETEEELAALGRRLPDEPAAREAYARAREALALARKPADLERVRRALAEVRELG